MTLSASQQSFLSSIYPHAVAAGQQTGIDPFVIMSQAALESGFGQHAPNNNYFGIKGPGGTQTTQEFIGGSMQTVQASFAGYSDLGASVQGWADFITGNKRYKAVTSQTDPLAQIAALGSSGYATDPNYGSKLSSVFSTIKNGFTGGSGNSGDTFRGGRKHSA